MPGSVSTKQKATRRIALGAVIIVSECVAPDGHTQ